MSDTKHTPEKWTWVHDTNRKDEDQPVGRNIGIRDEDGSFVALIEGDVFSMEQQEATADLIIRSVNTHHGLLTALSDLERRVTFGTVSPEHLQEARKALATARA